MDRALGSVFILWTHFPVNISAWQRADGLDFCGNHCIDRQHSGIQRIDGGLELRPVWSIGSLHLEHAGTQP